MQRQSHTCLPVCDPALPSSIPVSPRRTFLHPAPPAPAGDSPGGATPGPCRSRSHLLRAAVAAVAQRVGRAAGVQDVDPQGVDRPHQDSHHSLHRKLLENDNPAAAQKSSIDLEGGVLRGRPNQCDGSTLHVRKERVLIVEENKRN